MGATLSTLGQGEDPLIHSFRQMIDRLDLDNEIQPAASRLLLCGVNIAINRTEWQKNSDDQIKEAIVSLFLSLFAVASFRRGFAALPSPTKVIKALTCSHGIWTWGCLSEVLDGFFGIKSHSSPRRRAHLHSLASTILSW